MLNVQFPRECFIFPAWPAPGKVRAVATTRNGGISRPPFASFNLGAHVGDNPVHVANNRQRLREALELPREPLWLQQVHGATVIAAEQITGSVEGDACYACTPGRVCAVLTADCLPVLLCERSGSCVAALHCGWRGLINGVIDATLARLACAPEQILAWLGPAIGPDYFVVGEEVYNLFMVTNLDNGAYFRPSRGQRWLVDLYGLTRRQLQASGVTAIYGDNRCTVTEREQFFSYRRDGVTGRMATLIWLAE